MDYLKHFYEQEHVREAVRLFLHDILDEQVLDATYKGNDVSGYKETKEVIDGMFNRLRGLYEKEKPNKKENGAR